MRLRRQAEDQAGKRGMVNKSDVSCINFGISLVDIRVEMEFRRAMSRYINLGTGRFIFSRKSRK